MSKALKFQQFDDKTFYISAHADEEFIKTAAAKFIKAAAIKIGTDPIDLCSYIYGHYLGIIILDAFGKETNK